MISFFGDGGCGGTGDAAVSAGAGVTDAEAGAVSADGWLLALIWSDAESLEEVPAGAVISEVRSLVLFFPAADLGLSAAEALSEEGLAPGFAVAAGVAAAAGAVPNCRLLTTVLTPGTDAAWRL